MLNCEARFIENIAREGYNFEIEIDNGKITVYTPDTNKLLQQTDKLLYQSYEIADNYIKFGFEEIRPCYVCGIEHYEEHMLKCDFCGEYVCTDKDCVIGLSEETDSCTHCNLPI